MPKSIGKRHAIFIQELIDAGDTPENEIKAYRKAYPSCKSNSTARKNCHRLRQNADISALIAEGLAARQKIIADTRKAEIEKIAKDRLLSQVEVDAILCDIIAGRTVNTTKRPMYNPIVAKWENVIIETPPTASDRIAAIDKYNRRHGGYAPSKFDINTNDPDRLLIPGEDDQP